MSAGRICRLSYRYPPQALRQGPAMQTDALYVVGGLYGNEPALEAVLKLFASEPTQSKHLIFNGDFNWFNIAKERFVRINEVVLEFDAIRGNVETEFARGAHILDDDAGCGCAYPDWVDEHVVERSNEIIKALRVTAAHFPELCRQLAGLPMFKRFNVGATPVGVVHGDAQSLAGWGFAAEHLCQAQGQVQASTWFDLAEVRVFACSHTCTPAFQPVPNAAGNACLVANNGAAGMPNFLGSQAGLLTRIAVTPPPDRMSLYGTRIDSLYVDALPIHFDNQAWQTQFLAQWPADSAAHRSYWNRILKGPSWCIEQAFPPETAILPCTLPTQLGDPHAS